MPARRIHDHPNPCQADHRADHPSGQADPSGAIPQAAIPRRPPCSGISGLAQKWRQAVDSKRNNSEPCPQPATVLTNPLHQPGAADLSDRSQHKSKIERATMAASLRTRPDDQRPQYGIATAIGGPIIGRAAGDDRVSTPPAPSTPPARPPHRDQTETRWLQPQPAPTNSTRYGGCPTSTRTTPTHASAPTPIEAHHRRPDLPSTAGNAVTLHFVVI